MKDIPRSKYSAIHHWLKYHYGQATKCENKECEGKSTTYQWAKKQGKPYDYKRSHFIQLCCPCHHKYDLTEETRENARKASFSSRKTHCPKGHEYTPDNIYWAHDGKYRNCLTCKKENKRKRAARIKQEKLLSALTGLTNKV